MGFVFLCLFIYLVISGVTMPFFVRREYSQQVRKLDSLYPAELTHNRKQALELAQKTAIVRSLIWPGSFPLYLATIKINAEIAEEDRKQAERNEAQRIIREYEENDPVNKAFKSLEKEEKRNKQVSQDLVLRQPKLNTSFNYSNGGVIATSENDKPDYYEIRSFDGRTYIRSTPQKPKVLSPGIIITEIKSITKQLKYVERLIDEKENLYIRGLISREDFKKDAQKLYDEVQTLKKEIDTLYVESKH